MAAIGVVVDITHHIMDTMVMEDIMVMVGIMSTTMEIQTSISIVGIMFIAEEMV